MDARTIKLNRRRFQQASRRLRVVAKTDSNHHKEPYSKIVPLVNEAYADETGTHNPCVVDQVNVDDIDMMDAHANLKVDVSHDIDGEAIQIEVVNDNDDERIAQQQHNNGQKDENLAGAANHYAAVNDCADDGDDEELVDDDEGDENDPDYNPFHLGT